MRIVLLNLSNNITDYSTTPSAETIMIKRLFEEKFNVDCDIISNNDGQYTKSFDSIKDINHYDKLLVINGAVNFFGGSENKTIINNYKLMSQYKSTIYYLLTDLRLPFKPLWPSIKNKDWANKYNENDFNIQSKIVILSQGNDLNITKNIHKNIDNIDIKYCPIDQYRLHVDFNIQSSPTKLYDVIYGGSFRGGKREDKLVEFLFDIPYNVQTFGTMKLQQFKNDKYKWTNHPTFIGKQPMNQVQQINSQALCSIIIGDKNYNNNMITIRVWETMMSDCICFIDKEFDKDQNILQLDDFYINNKQDFINKINKIKNNNDYRLQLLHYQHQKLMDYVNNFNNFKNIIFNCLQLDNNIL